MINPNTGLEDNSLGRPRIYIDRNSRCLHLKSAYEVAVAFQLDVLKFIWWYEKEFFTYIENGKEKQYLPDFYIQELDMFVEVSGWREKHRKQLKIHGVRKSGKNIVELRSDYVDKLPLSNSPLDRFNFASEYDPSSFSYYKFLFEEAVGNCLK